MPKTAEFKEEDKIKMLLWCDSHCCLCNKACGTNIEIAHIDQSAGNNIDNGIPLCYNCHAEIGSYNKEHPRGNKYRPKELRARRNQVYEEHTRHLVPPILPSLISPAESENTRAIRPLPFVATRLQHFGDSLPVQVRVEAKVILGDRKLGLVRDSTGYYNGRVRWNINPRTVFSGGFSIPQECATSNEELKIEMRVTVIDQFKREHKLLPQCFRYVRERGFWNLEPKSFTRWT